jgi:hypothetical protein
MIFHCSDLIAPTLLAPYTALMIRLRIFCLETNGDFNNFPTTNVSDFLNPSCFIKKPTVGLQGNSSSVVSLILCGQFSRKVKNSPLRRV